MVLLMRTSQESLPRTSRAVADSSTTDTAERRGSTSSINTTCSGLKRTPKRWIDLERQRKAGGSRSATIRRKGSSGRRKPSSLLRLALTCASVIMKLFDAGDASSSPPRRRRQPIRGRPARTRSAARRPGSRGDRHRPNSSPKRSKLDLGIRRDEPRCCGRGQGVGASSGAHGGGEGVRALGEG